MAVNIATKDDLEKIMHWLEAEYRKDGEGFFCNRNIIESDYADNNLFVFHDENDFPVGFISGSPEFPNIMSVKKDHRRKGVGRSLAAFMLKKAKDEDLCALKIQCAPQTSIGFWQAMGFQVLDPTKYKNDVYAYYILEKKHILPKGEIIPVAILFYPECKKWDQNQQPLKKFLPKAVMVNNRINLEDRVVFVPNIYPGFDGTGRDPVVEIVVDGKTVYLDKAKYDGAGHVGVMSQSHCFYLDHICCR